LLVAPTGGGKSLVRDVCGVCFRGITLTIIPLLSLISWHRSIFQGIYKAEPGRWCYYRLAS
jgi:hypothetical protein